MTNSIEVRVDSDLDAAYIRLSDQQVARTIEMTDEVYVDLDEFNMVVGLEVLSLDAVIPFSRLKDERHVHSDVIELLRRIQPSVAASMRLTQGTDGTARQSQKAEPMEQAA